MTRFARAKGSKSSNERLPLDSTPWHVMKQQLEVALDKEKDQEPQTKTKSAKQLLNEKEDLYYAKSLGNVSGDWAEFENSKVKTNTVKNGKVEKKQKDEKKKLKQTFKKSVEEGNIENGINVVTEENQKPLKNKKESKEKKQKLKNIDQSSEIDSNQTKEKTLKNTDNNVISNETKLDKKKKKKDKNINNISLDATDIEQSKEKKRKNKQIEVTTEIDLNKTPEKKLKRKNDNTAVEEDSSQIKEKKRKNKEKKKNKSTEEPISTSETVANDSSKSEGLPESGNKMSKRQKRNQKKQIQKQESSNDNAQNATFNTEGNDWNNSVNVINNRFDENGAPNKFREKRRFGSLEEKNLYRFGNNVPRKFLPKTAKLRDDNQEHKRRKPELNSTKMTINGMDVEIVKYDGFPIRKEDAERLTELRKEMVMKGIPKPEIDAAMKLERRKCEKALARIRKQVCFHCRRAGHNLSDCPELGKEEAGTGICFKCGSTEHTHFECKVNKSDDYRYAKCFICREQGHLAKQCPDNPKGMYPDGGCCKICGDVTHLKKDCPDLVKEKEETAITLDTIKDTNLESIDGETNKVKKEVKTPKKVVKF